MQHENAIYIDYLPGNREPDPLHFGALGDRSPTPALEDETTEEEPRYLRESGPHIMYFRESQWFFLFIIIWVMVVFCRPSRL